MAMNVFQETGLIAAREIRKNIRSAKGLVMVIISLLGGVATSLLLQKLRAMDEAQISPEQLHALQQAMLEKKYGDLEMAKYLASAPPVLLALLLATVWLNPGLVAVMGFDGISGELQHRSVRYWTVRSRRVSYFAGKFLGLWAVISIVTLVMHALIWGLTMVKSSGGMAPADTLLWGIRFWAVTLPISAAWCGIATLIGSQFRAPMIALLVTFATFFVLWICDAIGEVGNIKALTYIYPNTYDAWLLSPKFDKVALGALICMAFGVVTTGAGTFLFTRRDV
jgi:ABC-type transport system involved in multi-copper enzyme maturation permease subunit